MQHRFDLSFPVPLYRNRLELRLFSEITSFPVHFSGKALSQSDEIKNSLGVLFVA